MAFLRDRLFWYTVVGSTIVVVVLYWLKGQGGDVAVILTEPKKLFLLVLLYPLLEELVFRGFVQDKLKKFLMNGSVLGISLANILTSCIFVLLHVFYAPRVWTLSVFIPSLVFGFFKDRTRKLGAPIALHVYFNFIYLLFFY